MIQKNDQNPESNGVRTKAGNTYSDESIKSVEKFDSPLKRFFWCGSGKTRFSTNIIWSTSYSANKFRATAFDATESLFHSLSQVRFQGKSIGMDMALCLNAKMSTEPNINFL
jgi:hypothetical protein